MRFGICTSVDRATEVKAAGWDYVEENVQNLLQGQLAEPDWRGAERVRDAALPVPAANSLVPGGLKITGPQVDFEKLQAYMGTVLRRAAATGTKLLVFGSGAARKMPEGYDRKRGWQQVLDFCVMSAARAAPLGITLVAEPLQRGECNLVNSVAEAMELVQAVNRPNFQCLVDSFHFWQVDEPLENLRRAMPWIRHVHVADRDGRVACGETGRSDYRPFFAVLKQGGYDATMSVEDFNFTDIRGVAPRVLAFIKKQWAQA